MVHIARAGLLSPAPPPHTAPPRVSLFGGPASSTQAVMRAVPDPDATVMPARMQKALLKDLETGSKVCRKEECHRG